MILPIILTAQASRAGKDYTYKTLERISSVILADSSCKRFQLAKVAFADKLKTVVFEMFSGACPGLRVAAVYEVFPDLRKQPILGTKTVVDLWIEVGEFFRAIDPTVWIRPVTHKIQQEGARAQGRGAAFLPVITDCRFPFELAEIRRLFPDAVVVEIVPTHGKAEVLASDSYLADVVPDYRIINDGTDNLKGEVFQCFRSILKSRSIYG